MDCFNWLGSAKAARLLALSAVIYTACATWAEPVRAQQRPVAAFSSAPVDLSLYRPEAVRRWAKQSAGWRIACDEIIPLQRRFCSLSTAAHPSHGALLASLTISTGQDGRPAALLVLPHGVFLPDGVSLKAEGAKATPRRLRMTACDANACQLVYEPARTEIGVLRSGGALRFSFEIWSAPSAADAASLSDSKRRRQVTVMISGAGFQQALAAGME